MQPLSEEDVLLYGQGHQNVGTCANGTGYGGRVSGCSGFGTNGVASGCLDVYDETCSLSSGTVIVTLDVLVCSSCLRANNAPHSLVGGVVMVTLDHTGCSSVGGESPLLVGWGADGDNEW
jgi:hypothetical protein